MAMSEDLNREGDLNTGAARQAWLWGLPDATRALLEEDAAVFLHQSMSTPCLDAIVGAEGCHLIDAGGRRILDFHGNSAHPLGHGHPAVLAAVAAQLGELSFIPRRYTSAIAVRAARALVDRTSSGDFKVLFTPSGSAAVGLALKLARKATGRSKVLSMWESFHGAGLDTISVGGEAVFSKDMGPLLPGCLKAIPYNAYRNLLGSGDPQAVADFCLDYVEYQLRHEGDVGAILLEPIRATDTHVPPRAFFQRLRAICDRHGVLLVFDEIPTALGRSGAFFVHQLYDVEPDVLVLGKGLGGGVVPQAAVLARSKLDCAGDISLGHYTHEKPALGCAAVCATLQAIDDHALLERCRERSAYAARRAAELQDRHALVGDVRIQGLLITFELVTDRAARTPAVAQAERVLYHCLARGLSFKVAGGNCITWHPPLIVSEADLEFAFQVLDGALGHAAH
jgi:4-aminobutyrate aminotransferase